jgi:hypothetical protein
MESPKQIKKAGFLNQQSDSLSNATTTKKRGAGNKYSEPPIVRSCQTAQGPRGRRWQENQEGI